MILSAVVADDEPLARRKLRDLLAGVAWVRCVAETSTGLETVTVVNQVRPDLLFLDVHMPGMSGLQVLDELRHRPHVVFTTAHSDYAVTAFEVRAVDYLLKPFGRRRFAETMERVRDTVVGHARRDTPQLAYGPRADGQPITQLLVRLGKRIVPIAVADVSRFEARDDYVAVYTATAYLAAINMNELERRLDPDRFLRIHRSHIVNLAAVRSIAAHSSGRFLITMLDGTRLFASRARSRTIRRRAV